MAGTGYCHEWEKSLQSAKIELRSGTHREDLTRREQYALGVSEFLEELNSKDNPAPSPSSKIVHRFWKFALAEGFSTNSLHRVSAAAKGGSSLRGILLASATLLSGVIIGVLLLGSRV